MRKGDEDWVKKCMEYRVEGRRPVGRPRKKWLESVEADMAELEINKEDVHDRRKWRSVNVMNRKSNHSLLTQGPKMADSKGGQVHKWIRKIPNKDLKVTKNSRVCINHFEEKDIKRFDIFKCENGDPDIKVSIYC